MKAKDLNQALNDVDFAYLMEVDTPEKENQTMKYKKRIRYYFLAAALIGLLSITVYAVELLNIQSYQSGKSKQFQTYSQINQAIAHAELQAEIPEEFSNGFRFQSAEVQEVDAMDEQGERVLTLKELIVYYQNQEKKNLILRVMKDLEGLPEDERTPTASKTLEEVELNYYRDLYKFVPEDYQLSEAEQEWANQPGHYVSYGADEVREQTVNFLIWTERDLKYSILGWNTVEPEILFAMAEEMID